MQDGICSIQQDGLSLYRDLHHLNTRGALLLAPAIIQMLAGL